MKRPTERAGFYISEHGPTAGNAAPGRCDIPGTSLSVCISESAAFVVAEHYQSRSARNSLLSRDTQPPATNVTGILLGRYEIDGRKVANIENLFPVAWRPVADGERRSLTPEQIISLLA